MSEILMDGSKVRVLNVIDDYNRQYLGFDLGRSLPASRVTRALDDFIDFHGKPKRIRIDNGPEYTSHHMQLWAKEQEIELQFIQPGKPTQNSYIERFNHTYRTEVLDAYLFTCMHEIRIVTEVFQHKYNHYKPHGSLYDMHLMELKSAELPYLSVTANRRNKQGGLTRTKRTHNEDNDTSKRFSF